MATTTTNLNMTKPAYTDVADIMVLNNNFDIIDNELTMKVGSGACTSGSGTTGNLCYMNTIATFIGSWMVKYYLGKCDIHLSFLCTACASSMTTASTSFSIVNMLPITTWLQSNVGKSALSWSWQQTRVLAWRRGSDGYLYPQYVSTATDGGKVGRTGSMHMIVGDYDGTAAIGRIYTGSTFGGWSLAESDVFHAGARFVCDIFGATVNA